MIPNRDTEAPLLLSARVSINSGGTALADTAALSSPFRKPIVIDEIRFTCSAPITAAINGPAVNWGGLVKAKLSLGRIPLTRDFIYLWLFGTAINSELTVDPAFGGVSVATRYTFAHFRWKLPKPLYIPAGQTLTCEFARDTDPATYTINDEGNSVVVDVAYAGRYLKPTAAVPESLDVPYVTSYVPPAGPTGVSPYTAQSSENDLVNPFDIPLNVQRMVGRLRVLLDSSADDMVIESGTILTPTVQLRDSWGHTILRDFTSFMYVFSWPRRSWTFHRILEPKERYNVSFRNILNDSSTAIVLPMISIVGWREEAFR